MRKSKRRFGCWKIFCSRRSRTRKAKHFFLMTADHANIDIDPATTVYLNGSLQDLLPMIRRNRKGEYGALRVIAGYVYTRQRRQFRRSMRYASRKHKRQSGNTPHRRSRHKGFFGTSPPSAALSTRIGDLVILPYAGESVWWYEAGRMSKSFMAITAGYSRRNGDGTTCKTIRVYDD